MARTRYFVLLSALLLGGCSLLPQPEPDPVLQELMADYQHASTLAENQELAQALDADAEEVRGEALRLCGTNKDGNTPSSCVEALGQTEQRSAKPLEDLPAEVLEAAQFAPQESMAVIAPQFVHLVGLGLPLPETAPAKLTEEANPEIAPEQLDADGEAVLAAAEYEHAVIYALGTATPAADAATRKEIAELSRLHAERLSLLRATGETLPAALPAYDTSQYADPSTTAGAREMLEQLRADDVTYWENFAAKAVTPSLRVLALNFAAGGPRTDVTHP